MRVWVDLTNTAHVLVLRPLVEALEEDGHEVEITARPLSHTVELLEDWGHPFRVVGRHGGSRRAGKALAAGARVPQLVAFARGRALRPRARARLGRPSAGGAAARGSRTRPCSTTSGRSPSTT